MSNGRPPQNTAEKNAQKYFRKADQSETFAKQVRKTERAVNAAKTAKLRGLRLAKEQADKQEADKQAAEQIAKNPGAKPRIARKRASPGKPAMVRMTY